MSGSVHRKDLKLEPRRASVGVMVCAYLNNIASSEHLLLLRRSCYLADSTVLTSRLDIPAHGVDLHSVVELVA